MSLPSFNPIHTLDAGHNFNPVTPAAGRGGGGGGHRGGFERDRDGDEMMGELSERGGRSQQGGSWERGRPWERGGRGGGGRAANFDGDIPMKQDTTAVLLVRHTDTQRNTIIFLCHSSDRHVLDSGMMWTRNLWICPTCTTTRVSYIPTRRVLGSRRVWVEKVFLCLCVCVDLKENGVRGSMYSREFVSSVLELVKANCPEVCLSLSTRQLMRV